MASALDELRKRKQQEGLEQTVGSTRNAKLEDQIASLARSLLTVRNSMTGGEPASKIVTRQPFRGERVRNAETGELEPVKGPVYTNFVPSTATRITDEQGKERDITTFGPTIQDVAPLDFTRSTGPYALEDFMVNLAGRTGADPRANLFVKFNEQSPSSLIPQAIVNAGNQEIQAFQQKMDKILLNNFEKKVGKLIDESTKQNRPLSEIIKSNPNKANEIIPKLNDPLVIAKYPEKIMALLEYDPGLIDYMQESAQRLLEMSFDEKTKMNIKQRLSLLEGDKDTLTEDEINALKEGAELELSKDAQTLFGDENVIDPSLNVPASAARLLEEYQKRLNKTQ